MMFDRSRSAGATDAAGRRLLVIADSDSYVKWGATLASTLPPHWRVQLVVLASPVQPSATQLAHALAGTAFSPTRTRILHLDDLDGLLDVFDPHAVLLSLRGPFVRVVAPLIERRPNRPVLVSGFPGLTIPAVPKAVVYREQTDLVVLHSRREVREFRANAAGLGLGTTFALATLPFLAGAGAGAGGGARATADGPDQGTTDAAAAPRRDGADRPGARPEASARTDIVFATQAKVPAEREDRVHLLGALAELARRRPDRRVVVKVRARRGEAQTHDESFDYADLMSEVDPPANLVIEDGPMAEKLARASALVTVSSTAVLEAVALELPALVIQDYGVSAAMINLVFEDSGLIGSTADLVEGRFRSADASWLADNYFHDREAADWVRRLDAFIEAREIVPLARLERRRDLSGGVLRAAFERRRMLGSHDRSVLGTLAWGVGVPARGVVRRVRRLRSRWERRGVPTAVRERVAGWTPESVRASEAGSVTSERSADGGRVPLGMAEV
ncbi:hypothetical protein SAMN05428970_1420 [Agromyces sp. CF514]|uniref:DUF6716 putative glycosyltransferase n=1 Tax=Agromyces sp. CF514 TaxID=1881031 RepID=UPI0008EA4C5A|nr:DUF6716 putative glycosyltransferase [Agromyces sp. CF514]SFR72741.1 hypothetical protein SAMN05428970_1420 [Agromyces sp. CF514]